LAEAPDFPEPAAPKMILADLPMPETLAGPPQMPPVAKLELAAPETLAILAAPPKFETVDAIAAPVQPGRQEEKRAEPEARKAEPQRIAKPEPKAEPGRKQPEPERKPEKKQAEKKTAEKPAKPEKSAREARKGNSAKADQKKKPDPAKAGGNPAAGVAGKGSGAKDRKQGEAGKVASKASGNAAQYGALVNREVQRAFRYPAEAQRAGMKGVVRVQIRIDSSGRLTSASVRSSSGHALLDREALATVRRAAPFPKPPAGMAADSFSINLRFSR
jgi:protein TonB